MLEVNWGPLAKQLWLNGCPPSIFLTIFFKLRVIQYVAILQLYTVKVVYSWLSAILALQRNNLKKITA